MSEMKKAFRPGECCATLQKALSDEVTRPALGLDEHGVLWIGLGFQIIDNRIGWVSNRVDYCPFCGSEVDHYGEAEERKH